MGMEPGLSQSQRARFLEPIKLDYWDEYSRSMTVENSNDSFQLDEIRRNNPHIQWRRTIDVASGGWPDDSPRWDALGMGSGHEPVYIFY